MIALDDEVWAELEGGYRGVRFDASRPLRERHENDDYGRASADMVTVTFGVSGAWSEVYTV